MSYTSNVIMQINLLVSSYVLANSIRSMAFVLKVTANMYIIFMLITLGIVYVHSSFLLCSSFSIEQQWQAGYSLLWLTAFLLILLVYKSLAWLKLQEA